MFKPGEQENLKKEYEKLISSNISLKTLDNKNQYKSLFPKPNGCEQFGETFYRIGDIVVNAQSGKDVLGRKFDKVYFMKIKSKVGDEIRKDEYSQTLFKDSKGKTRSSSFINLYKNLIALKCSNKEIKEYFNLKDIDIEYLSNYL